MVACIARIEKTMQSTRGRVGALDGLRGVAILLVLMVHLVSMGAAPQHPKIIMWALLRVMYYGWTGVDLFFVLSGFLITGILIDSKTSTNYFKTFYMRRVLRIFPIYYLTLFVLLALEPVFASTQPWLRALYPNPASWVSFFFYYQNWWMPICQPGETILSHFWSLGVEEQFYMIWPACVLLAAPRRLKWVCLIGSLCALTLRFILAEPGTGSELIISITATRADALLIGCFLAMVVRNPDWLRRVKPASPYVFSFSLLGLGAIGYFGHELWSRGYFTETLGFTLIACAYGYVVLWAFLQNGTGSILDRVLNTAVLCMFGKYSYGIYVYHLIIFLVLARIFHTYSWYGQSFVPSMLACFAFIGVSLGVAALSFHFIETPFLSMKKYFQPATPNGSPLHSASSAVSALPADGSHPAVR
jgi:peptidoglycan/LPS O-acetylase OafA/YrhL